jgi:hypothetical protein
MKKFLFGTALIALMLFSAVARAVDFEVGGGIAHYTTRGDMMWYQEGLPHKLDLNAPVIEAGLSGNVVQQGRWGLDWRALWVYVGNVSSSAIATYDDNYDKRTKSCIGQCKALDLYTGNGHMNGLRLTLEPNYTWNGWKFGAETGVYIYRPTWHAHTYDKDGSWHTPKDYQAPIQFAPVVGASVSRGPWSLAYMHYFSKTNRDPYYAIWKATDTLTLRYRF